jgi:hypothetical protein
MQRCMTKSCFMVWQVGSTLIAAFGFAAYTHPRPEWSVTGGGKFTQLSDGHGPPFLGSSNVPIYNTEGVYTASVIGCTCEPPRFQFHLANC